VSFKVSNSALPGVICPDVLLSRAKDVRGDTKSVHQGEPCAFLAAPSAFKSLPRRLRCLPCADRAFEVSELLQKLCVAQYFSTNFFDAIFLEKLSTFLTEKYPR